MSNVSRAANSALRSALANSSGGFTAAENNLLNQLSGEDKTRMQQQMALARQQETMASVMGSLRSMGAFGARAASSQDGFSAPGLTGKQQALLATLKDSPEDQKRMAAQMALQNEQEQVAFISNMMKKRNEISMSIIGNLK